MQLRMHAKSREKQGVNGEKATTRIAPISSLITVSKHFNNTNNVDIRKLNIPYAFQRGIDRDIGADGEVASFSDSGTVCSNFQGLTNS